MLLGLSFSFSTAVAQSAPASMGHDMNTTHDHEMDMSHDHGAAVPVSYSDLTKTAAMLEKARGATEKYQDVRVAEADGYQAIGPDVPGMGIHYIGSPFPKSLAQWHRHENLCVLADRSVRAHLNESVCAAQGGHFTAESQWMVHAWIWKDSPTGVFAPTNPSVQ
jgi:hypothetical protein